ncbi:MAG: flotillin-like FloA family protein [Phycisphaerae bacterium]
MLAAGASTWLPIVLVAIVMLGILLFAVRFLRLWIHAQLAGVPVSIFDLIGMRLRRTDARAIVANLVRARRAGLDLTAPQLESHALAGGRVDDLVTAMIAAHVEGLSPNWETLAAVDLRGDNVIRFVASAMEPDAPPAGDAADREGPSVLGAMGTAETYVPMPGRVTIDGEPAAAVAEQAPIERGAAIEVVAVVTHLVVRQKSG